MSLLRELNRLGALRHLDDALANTLRRLELFLNSLAPHWVS